MKIIDAHTHFYPKQIAESPQDWAAARGEKYWGALVGERPDGRRSLQGFPTEEKFEADMAAAGVSRAIIQGWYWQNPDTCDEFNAMISELLQRRAGKFSAFASVQPRFPEQAVRTARAARKMGFCGIGEIHDGVQKFSFLSPEFEALAEACAAERLGVCVHLTERGGRDYPGKVKTNFSEAFEAAKKFANVNFIFAHWCGGALFDSPAQTDELFSLANAYFDSAASPLLGDCSQWKAAARHPKNSVYGSDYPIRLYPKKFKTEEMATIANEARENADFVCAEDFFSNNILRLI